MQSDNNLRMFTVSIDGEEWRQVASLADAAAGDKVFVLEAASGSIRFGDGARGRRPASGASVSVSYRQGGGAAGDVAASMMFRWLGKNALLRVSLAPDGMSLNYADAAAEEYSGQKRVNYFSGQVLGADDFRAYFLGKQRRHNLLLHGWGVVHGLEVSRGTSGTSLVIAPGYALDPQGRELLLPIACELEIGEAASPQYVLAEYTEREADSVPVPGSDGPVATRIEEGVAFRLASDHAGAVAVGRLVQDTSGWSVDPKFRPRRPHSRGSL